MTVRQASYIFDPIGKDAAALIEQYPSESNQNCGASVAGAVPPEEGPSGGIGVEEKSSIMCSTREVRVLVMFTAAAQARLDPVTTTREFITELGSALGNSSIAQQTLRFTFTEPELLSSFTEDPTNIEGDRDRVSTNNEVAAARQRTQADLVVVLTDGNYATTGGFFLGAAFVEPGFRDMAHAVVEIDSPVNEYTFSHEIVHLFGAQHTIEDPSLPNLRNVAAFARAHMWEDRRGAPFSREDTEVFTILDNSEQNPFIPNEFYLGYSNPFVSHRGEHTGVSNQRDNVSQIIAWASRVGCYYERSLPSSSISGPSDLPPGNSAIYSATTINCDASPTYRWETSPDGYNYSFAGTGTSVRIYATYSRLMYIRLVTTCGTQQHVAFMTVHVGIEDCGDGVPCLRGPNAPGTAAQSRSIHAFPNPVVADVMELELTGFSAGSYSLTATRVGSEELVYTSKFNWEGDARSAELELPLAHLPAGSYVITATDAEGVVISTVITRL